MYIKNKAITLVILLVGLIGVKSQEDLGDCFSSRSTWYEAIQHGNCGYGQLTGQTGPGTLLIAAAATVLYNGSYSCGECYEIFGPSGNPTTVMIVDQCPDPGWCDTSFPHLDLSPQAFNASIGNSVGVAMTTVKKVSCDVKGNIKAFMKDADTTTSWFEFMVFNHKVGIASISVEDQTGKITQLPRRSYNYWTYNGDPATFPVIAHVTSIYGDQVDVYLKTPTGNTLYEGEGQFGVPSVKLTDTNCSAPFPVDPEGWIYQNGLVKPLNYDHPNLGWADWSNGVTVNWADTTAGATSNSTKVASGTVANNNAIQIGTDLPVTWAGHFSSLEFYIKTEPAGSNINVMYGGGTGSGQTPATTTSWTKFTYDLSKDLGAPASLGKPTVLKFLNRGTSSVKVYLDQIRLVPV